MNERKGRKRRGNYPKRQPPLDERHYRAIDMLSDPRYNRGTHAEIARRLGISRMTLHRWRQRKDFQRELDRAINRKVNERFEDIRQKQRRWTAFLNGAMARGDAKSLERTFRSIDII